MSKNSNESPRLTAEEIRRKREAIQRVLAASEQRKERRDEHTIDQRPAST